MLGDDVLHVMARRGDRRAARQRGDDGRDASRPARVAVECRQMMLLPPALSCAPMTNSSWPPTPEYCRGPIVSAMTCPERSTASAPLMLTIRRLRRMMAGSLTCATGSMRTSGLRSHPSVERAAAGGEGGDREAVVDPLVVGDLAGLVQVHDAVDEHLGVDAEVALAARRRAAAATMLGMPPMPICKRRAVVDQALDVLRDRCRSSVTRARRQLERVRSDSTTQSISETWMRWPP